MIAEDKDALLSSVQVVDHNKLLVVYSRDVKSELYQYELESGKQVERLLPDLVGTIEQIAARHSDDHAFVKFGSFVNPGQVVRLDWDANSAPSAIKSKQVAYYDTQVEGIKAEDFVFRASVHRVQGRNACAHVRDAPQDRQKGRNFACDPVLLRRLQHPHHTGIPRLR